jgi:hypothetical protein
MKTVEWTVKCRTTVDTDDDDEAREQVNNLFENKEWGEVEGREKCASTVELMNIRTIQ